MTDAGGQAWVRMTSQEKRAQRRLPVHRKGFSVCNRSGAEGVGRRLPHVIVPSVHNASKACGRSCPATPRDQSQPAWSVFNIDQCRIETLTDQCHAPISVLLYIEALALLAL